jgi:hypothetical protein
MSNKSEPKKKAGQDTKKKRRNMRAAVAARQQAAKPEGESTDEVDKIKYKRGSQGDRTTRQSARV